MMSDNTKKSLRRFEYVFVIVLIVAVPLLFFRPSITGFVASDTKAQILNMNFTESQALNLASNNGSIYISSFSISGEVIGDGGIAIYLVNDKNTRSLVYSNVGQKKKVSPLTGAATGIAAAHAVEVIQEGGLVIEEGEKLQWPGKIGENYASGSVTAVCIDSCYLSSDDYTASSFKLQIFVEPRTTFKLQEILYTIG